MQKRAKRDISETALPITISKFRKHFSIQTTPQNLGNITSETTFSHSKVVFWPLLRIKRAFSQNPPIAQFWKFRGSFPTPRPSKKSKNQAWYIVLHKNHLLITCVTGHSEEKHPGHFIWYIWQEFKWFSKTDNFYSVCFSIYLKINSPCSPRSFAKNNLIIYFRSSF